MAVKGDRLSYCLKHQDRVTDKRCSVCLKPICDECCMTTEMGNFCGQACYEKRVASNERMEVLKQEDEAQRIPRLMRKLISWALFFLFIFTCYIMYPKLPASVRKPIDGLVKAFHDKK
jgi:hypothetical protein